MHTVFQRRWEHMFGSVEAGVNSTRKCGPKDAWRVSENERQICDLRRNVTRANRRICARSMGVTERKFMVRFEEAMRRARKQAREYERFEWQLQEAFIAITEMKKSLGGWTDEEIALNKRTIVKNIKLLSNGDIDLLRKLYD